MIRLHCQPQLAYHSIGLARVWSTDANGTFIKPVYRRDLSAASRLLEIMYFSNDISAFTVLSSIYSTRSRNMTALRSFKHEWLPYTVP